jgi:hypothetical protein
MGDSKMDLKETVCGFEGLRWMELVQDRAQLLDLV